MRAILINERQDKPGLIGRPVVTQSGVVSALKGTHQAGQRVTLANMRSIKDKLAQVQLALNGANQNLLYIGRTLDLIDGNLEKLKEANQKLGDYWTQFLKHPITEYSIVRFIDVGCSMDRSREDMLGEYVDPYSIQYDSYPAGENVTTNGIILPRAGLFIVPNVNAALTQSMYVALVSKKPFIDSFRYRFPDGGYTALTFPATFRGPGSAPDALTAPSVFFYGPLYRHNDITAVQTKEDEWIIDPNQKNVAITPVDNMRTNFGWYGEHVDCFVSKPFYGDLDRYPDVEIPSNASWDVTNLMSFKNEDGDRYAYGNVEPHGCIVEYDDGYRPGITNPYEAAGHVVAVTVQGEKYYSIKYFRESDQYAGYPCSAGGWKTIYFPSLGYRSSSGINTRTWPNVFGESSPQSCYFRPMTRVPGQSFNVVPEYYFNVTSMLFNGNTLGIPPVAIGGRVINQTIVVKTTCRFGDDPLFQGIIGNLSIVPQPKGNYYDVQVWGISSGVPFLLTERTRMVYDAPINGSGADVRSIEQIIYNFDPWRKKSESGNFFNPNPSSLEDNKGKISEIFAITFDGHTISYRDNAYWRDVFDTLVQPAQWEFRKAYNYNKFYSGY